MKREIPLQRANRLINSGQVIFVTSAYSDKSNIVTLAWHMPVSHTPPLTAICVAKKHLSAQLITQQKQFAINIPDIKMMEAIVYCGSHSGRDVDKFKETRLTPLQPKKINVPVITKCIGYIECTLKETIETGDHFIFVGIPQYVSAEEELFDETWKPEKVKLVYHLGGRMFTTSSKIAQ
jgi:flavin reductase (DIM6/NTAB) family NADH-FMN oxidoreductase RutF